MGEEDEAGFEMWMSSGISVWVGSRTARAGMELEFSICGPRPLNAGTVADPDACVVARDREALSQNLPLPPTSSLTSRDSLSLSGPQLPHL